MKKRIFQKQLQTCPIGIEFSHHVTASRSGKI